VPNVQWKTPDDGQRDCLKHVAFLDKNKFGKLVRLLVLLKIKNIIVFTTKLAILSYHVSTYFGTHQFLPIHRIYKYSIHLFFSFNSYSTPYLEKPRGNKTQATGSKKSGDILAHWQTFPPIVGKYAPHLQSSAKTSVDVRIRTMGLRY
jgi:hypothetical protein